MIRERIRFTHRRGFVVAVALVATAGLVAACGGSSKSSSSSSSGGSSPSASPSSTFGGGLPNGTPKTGGSIEMAQAAIGASFDPALQQISAFTESTIMSAVFGQTLYQLSGSPDVSPGFITSFKPSTDFKTWTAILTPGLKFSDGTPFDAAAIDYAVQRDKDPAIGSIFAGTANSMTDTVVDSTTLKIALQAPDSQFDKTFMVAFGCIGSPTAEKAEGADFRTKPVGAGPFMLKTLTPGTSAVVVRNPNYALFAKGQPYLDQITFQAFASYPQQIAALTSGQAQMMFGSGEQAIDQMKAASSLNTYSFQSIGGGNFLYNMSTAPFNDPVARQAVTLALERTSAANAFAPTTPPSTNFFPTTNQYYDKQYDFPAQDKVKAQQLFDQLASEGKPLDFTFEFQSTFPDSVNTAQAVQSQLSTFKNIKVSVKGTPGPQQLADMRSGSFQMTQNGLYSQNAIPDAANIFSSTGATNYSKWNNPQVDAALADIRGTQDVAKQKADWGTIQAAMLKDLPMVWIDKGILGYSATKNITGIQLIGLGFMPRFGSIGLVS